MQSYPLESHVKLLLEYRENSLMKKQMNIRIDHDGCSALYHRTFCPTVLEKLFQVIYNMYIPIIYNVYNTYIIYDDTLMLIIE